MGKNDIFPLATILSPPLASSTRINAFIHTSRLRVLLTWPSLRRSQFGIGKLALDGYLQSCHQPLHFKQPNFPLNIAI